MNWLQALLLGIVQGLTEFLPVSSSGHLMIVRDLLGVDGDGFLDFTVTVHLATVLSGFDGTLVLTIHVRFMTCHRESVGEVYVASATSSSPQKVKPLSGIGLPFSRPMTSRREADEGLYGFAS